MICRTIPESSGLRFGLTLITIAASVHPPQAYVPYIVNAWPEATSQPDCGLINACTGWEGDIILGQLK